MYGKRFSFPLWAALFAFSSLQAEEFDKGGVSFPMEKISAERFGKTSGKEVNLLKNANLSEPPARRSSEGWASSVWIFQKENREKFEKEAPKLASAKIVDTESGKALELNRPETLEELMGKASPSFTNSFEQIIPLPDENGGMYRLSFECRNRLLGKNAFHQMVLLNYFDGSDPRTGRGKRTRDYTHHPIDSAPEWHLFSKEFTVPPKTRDLSVVIRADGCGVLQVKNLKLARLDAVPMPLTVELAPGKLLDNTFVLASGEPGLIAFKFRNNLPPGTLKYGKVMMNLELPAAVAVEDTNAFFSGEIKSSDLNVNGEKWKRWELEVAPALIGAIRNSRDFNGWSIACAAISGKAPAGTVWNCRYFLTEQGKPVSAEETFTLKMTPPFSPVTAPKQFLSGFSSVSGDLKFRKSETEKRFAEFVGKTGTTLVTAGITPAFAKKLYENGVRMVTSEAYGIANGYRIGMTDVKQKPDESRYLDVNGKTVMNGSTPATCPVAIYNRTPYYKEVVLPLLKAGVEGRDGLQPNWEPYSFVNKGCFCDRCRDEFTKFAKLSPEKAKEIWPAQLQVGCPYRDTAIRFRAYQHARLVKTLQEDAVGMGADKVGFCPEVGTDQIIRYPNSFQEQWEFTPYEYADSLKWLNVWGPYNWFLADQPYAYVKGANLPTWELSRRVVRDYRDHFKDPAKRAKLMAMPHGSQCNMLALGQPEGMAMDQLSSFLAGYDASILYFFPRGYDHRFWKALADSTSLIADNEDIVMNGRKKEGVTATPQSPFPAPVENIEPRYLPDVRTTDLLQVAAFEKDGRLLVAVGNFWEKGDVVFTLQIPGLDANRKYCVIEKAFNRQFVPEKGQFFTGKALADGILLHAGAMRWVFFEIIPAGNRPERAVTTAEMRKELDRCRKDNEAAAKVEAERDRALRAENEVGEFKKQSEGPLSCEPVLKDGRPMLKVTSGKNILFLNPRGMTLDSWSIDGIERVCPGYGLSAFWTPGNNGMVADANYRLTNQTVSASGLSVSGEFQTTVRNYPLLAGLKIAKSVTVSSDLRRVVFEVKLSNTLATAMNDVGYRWNLIPAEWSNKNGGGIECGGQKFRRPGANSLMILQCDPASEKTMRKLFAVKGPSLKIQDGLFRFTIPGKAPLEAAFRPADRLAGVAIWDTPGMISATFEPFYAPVLIAPGADITFSAEFKIH